MTRLHQLTLSLALLLVALPAQADPGAGSGYHIYAVRGKTAGSLFGILGGKAGVDLAGIQKAIPGARALAWGKEGTKYPSYSIGDYGSVNSTTMHEGNNLVYVSVPKGLGKRAEKMLRGYSFEKMPGGKLQMRLELKTKGRTLVRNVKIPAGKLFHLDRDFAPKRGAFNGKGLVARSGSSMLKSIYASASKVRVRVLTPRWRKNGSESARVAKPLRTARPGMTSRIRYRAPRLK